MRLDALIDQHVGQAVGAVHELRVGNALAVTAERLTVGFALRRLVDRLMEKNAHGRAGFTGREDAR